jgi:hypothetical protein
MDDKEYARWLFEILTGRWTRTSRWTHTAPTPGRFVVRRSPARPERTLLVTPDQWEEVVRKHHIRRWRLLEHVSELLAGTEAAVGTTATRNHVNP